MLPEMFAENNNYYTISQWVGSNYLIYQESSYAHYHPYKPATLHTGLMFHSHDLLTTDYTLTQCHLKGVMDLLELWVRRVWMYSCRGRDLLNSSPREGGSRKKQPTSSYIKVKLIYNQIILKIGYLHYLIKMKSFTTSF